MKSTTGLSTITRPSSSPFDILSLPPPYSLPPRKLRAQYRTRSNGTSRRRIFYRKIAAGTVARTLSFRTATILKEENKRFDLRLHRHCGGECPRDWTIVPPRTMQSRAPIDVSCEAAKDITFSCLRYSGETIIRSARACVAPRTYYSLLAAFLSVFRVLFFLLRDGSAPHAVGKLHASFRDRFSARASPG